MGVALVFWANGGSILNKLLPLAHEQAAAYCERLGISLAEYRRRFEAAPGVKAWSNTVIASCSRFGSSCRDGAAP
jgi:hypothetical protein